MSILKELLSLKAAKIPEAKGLQLVPATDNKHPDVLVNCHDVKFDGRVIGMVWQEEEGSDWSAEDSKSGNSWDMFDSKEEAAKAILRNRGVKEAMDMDEKTFTVMTRKPGKSNMETHDYEGVSKAAVKAMLQKKGLEVCAIDLKKSKTDEAFGIKIDGELWMKGDKPVSFASQEEAEDAILKSPSMSDKNSKVVPLNENEVAQAAGRALAGKSSGTTGTVPTQAATDADVADEEPKTAVNTPPAEKAAADAEAETDEPAAEFKIGDKVKPTAGPHKGQVHSVIHVFPDGRVNLTPDGLQPDQIKYRQGAVTARADQVELAESIKVPAGKSLLASFELMEAAKPKTLEHFKKRLKDTSDQMDRIIQDGGRIGANDPLQIEYDKLRREVAKLKKAK